MLYIKVNSDFLKENDIEKIKEVKFYFEIAPEGTKWWDSSKTDTIKHKFK